ncbi:SdrD B-like domain-containing protein [Anaerolineales bacterium HSG6]|nr:SdrD B-like domain-containing protein [Anaerolineales bacterium HSG6]
MSQYNKLYYVLTILVWLIIVSPASATINPEVAQSEASLAIGHLEILTQTGSTINAAMWVRPGEGSTCAYSNTMTKYIAHEFTVSATGDYDVISEQNFDGYIHLYANSFDPNSACSNYIDGNDDGSRTGDSKLYDQPLTAGTTYILVTSGYSYSDFGNFTNTISRVMPRPDLEVTQTNNGPVAENENATFTISVSNIGADSSENVILINNLPADVNVVSTSSSCNQNNETITCDLGNIAVDGKSTVEITVTSATGGIFISNQATVSTSTSELELQNNSSGGSLGITTDGEKPKIDITFLFDESGSMGDEIEEVRDRLNDIVNLLSVASDSRLGLVGFGARTADHAYRGGAHVHQIFTGDNALFATALEELVADGGYEPGFDAVAMALGDEMGYREGAGACTIMVTDEDSDTGSVSQADAIAALNNRNAVFLGIVDAYNGGTTSHYGPDAGSLAAETGGQVFNIQEFRVNSQQVLAAIIEKCVNEIVLRQGVIGDQAWQDTNQDGIHDNNEPALEGVTVNLFDAADDSLQSTTTTDVDGHYEFSSLGAGDYYVQFELLPDYNYTSANQGNDDTLDSDADPQNGKTATTSLSSDQEDRTWDVGMIPVPTGALRIHTFHDLNGNGQSDNAELGLNNWQVTVSSNQVADIVKSTDTVDAQTGWAVIDDLQPGAYTVCETLQSGWQSSTELCQNVNITVDQDTVVQFGNYQPATVLVKNQTSPNNGTSFDFLTTNLNPDIFQLAGDETYTLANLLPGTGYGVAETVNNGWQLTSATCDDGSPVDAISLTSGETVTCTFVNEAQSATLTVIKEVIGQAPSSDWNFNGTGDIGTFTLPAAGGQQSFNPPTGEYTLVETSVEGYLQSVACDDGSNGSDQVSVTLQPGQTLTCTFTSVFLTGEATLTIVKEASQGSFGFTSDIPDWGSFSLAHGSSTEAITVGAGVYTVQEDKTSFPDVYWSLTKVSCADGDGNTYLANSQTNNGVNVAAEYGAFTANITIPAGIDLTCTFLNERAGVDAEDTELESNRSVKQIYLPLILR